MSERPPPAAEPGSRAGRNLPVALVVGAGLGGLVLVTVYTVKPIFLGVVGLAVVMGLYELTRALATRNVRVPFIPLAAGAVAILVTSYVDGRHAMTAAMLYTIPLLVAWRVVRGSDGLVADLSASLLALLYLGFLAGFCALMLAAHDGDRRVTCFVATVVASDVGGYATGVLFGKHLLAPKISPKKSIEGLIGSMIMCASVGVILCTSLLHTAWWQGAVYGLAVAASAVLGDLGMSMVKRDLGVKDMGTLLPGHGGVLDRLDSLLPTAPVAWALLAAFVALH
ncbi:MAG TPA: phosphatidate cytidylyltransferase [Mycobacteriales bacterium]|nr:phosphatidate cytidylyltransferase [Mycobacteriales bacterium]